MAFTTSIAIAAPVERVWHCIEEPEQRKRWQRGLEETEYTHVPEDGGPVGTRFVARMREGGRVREYEGELLAREPNRLLTVRMGDRYFSVENTFRLAAADGGTRLELSCTTASRSLPARVMAPLGALLIRAIARRQLRALKALAEAGPVQ